MRPSHVRTFRREGVARPLRAMPGAVAPAASRAMIESTRVSHREVHRNHPAFPHAMVLTAYFVLSPVIGLSCHRHQRDAQAILLQCDAKHRHQECADIIANLTSASRCQDHTTSPSATCVPRLARRRVHRIPSRVRDDRDTPFVWDRTISALLLLLAKQEAKYFSKADWTEGCSNCLSGKSIVAAGVIIRESG
jgi:hypothetical protein